MKLSTHKKTNKKEKDFAILLRHYLRAHPIPFICGIETKDTRGSNSFKFSELHEGQINNAEASWGEGNLTRVASGTVGAPDYFWSTRMPTYLVINFPNSFCFIFMEKFVEYMKGSKKSVILENEAQKISHYYVTK